MTQVDTLSDLQRAILLGITMREKQNPHLAASENGDRRMAAWRDVATAVYGQQFWNTPSRRAAFCRAVTRLEQRGLVWRARRFYGGKTMGMVITLEGRAALADLAKANG
jgi:hypothetical protein